MSIELVESRWFGIIKKIKRLEEGDEIPLTKRPTERGFGGILLATEDTLRLKSSDSIEYRHLVGEPGSIGYTMSEKLRELNPEMYHKDEINSGLQRVIEEVAPQPKTRKPWVKRTQVRWTP